jgi:Tol biopolymer transport system component
VGEDISVALRPVWSPDGKTLLVVGFDGVGDNQSTNFWAASVAGGKSRKTDVIPFLTKNGIIGRNGFQGFGGVDWRGESLLFAAGPAVWALDLDADSLATSNLRKITTGTAQLAGVRGTPSRFVFTAGTSNDHLWNLPLDLNSGKVTGPVQAISHAGGSQFDPGMSSDGRVLAYTQFNPGSAELRVRDNVSGRESVLVTQPVRARVSPDGTKVAYSPAGTTTAIYLMDATGGQSRKLIDLEKGGNLFAWTADGASLVYYRNAPIRWFLFDTRTGAEQAMFSHPKLDVHDVRPSPDMKWVAFDLPGAANGPVKIAPLRGGRAGGEAEWITIAAYPGRNALPWWSPDGNLLYFLSMKDGYADIWAQRLHPASKQPLGEAFAVSHFHDFRTSPSIATGQVRFWPAVGKDRIIFSRREPAGNVWIGER